MKSKSDIAILQATSGSCKTLVDNTLRITFDFEPAHAKLAFKMFSERGTPAAIALIRNGASINESRKSEKEINTVQQESVKAETDQVGDGRPWGQYAASLYKTGFFHAPKLWSALGTDKQFRHWIQQQPSAYSGNYSEWMNGEGRCIAAHVRRSGEAGTGFKPTYSCIPLTDAEHRLQHQKGESALEDFEWEKARNDYIFAWCKSRFYEIFGVDSLTKIHPSDLVDYCVKHDLMTYLPRVYKDHEAA